tara:strand:+ start:38 stop:769 length:732 start_codon:yes stop_codon:yes gene_type:complete
VKITDYQQSRVYKWERDTNWFCQFKDQLNHEEIKYIVNRLNKVFGLTTKIHTKRANGLCHFNRSKNAIYLARYGFNWSVVLHEYAHAITKYHKPSHGDYFVSAYCSLLRYLHPDKPTYQELSASANKWNLDFVNLRYSDYDKKLKRVVIDIDKAPKPKVVVKKPKKKGVRYKEKCQELIDQHDWLKIERDDGWESELRIDVWDYDYSELNQDYFNEGSSGEYCTWSWKQAHDRALVLIDRRME